MAYEVIGKEDGLVIQNPKKKMMNLSGKAGRRSLFSNCAIMIQKFKNLIGF